MYVVDNEDRLMLKTYQYSNSIQIINAVRWFVSTNINAVEFE